MNKGRPLPPPPVVHRRNSVRVELRERMRIANVETRAEAAKHMNPELNHTPDHSAT